MEQRAGNESDAPEAVRLLWVRVGERACAIEVGYVDKVRSVPQLTAVPHASESVAGVGRDDGDVAVYLDAGVLAGVDSRQADTAVLLEGTNDQMPVGLLVSETDGMESVPIDRIAPADAVGLDTTVFAAAVTGGNEPLPLFGPDRLITIADQRRQ